MPPLIHESHQGLEQLATAAIVFDKSLKIIYINHSAEVLLELSHGQAFNQNIGIFFEDRDFFKTALGSATKLQSSYRENEYFIKSKQNKTICVTLTISQLNNKLGNFILEFIQMDQHLRVAKEEMMFIQQQANSELLRNLAHEIRNPLTSLKSASEILEETEDRAQRIKLINILNHDVQRIERLITDYSQILKDEVALSKEKMRKINLQSITQSVVDDFNNIYEAKRSIKVILNSVNNQGEYIINGIENRIEQIIANLLDNSISFSDNNQKILVEILRNENKNIILKVIDEGKGFKEKNTKKIFDRFYSNRPDNFGEHSGLGLNIVKNLVDLHGATINASNNLTKKGANVEIIFPRA